MSDFDPRTGLARVLIASLVVGATFGLTAGMASSTDPTAEPSPASSSPSIAATTVALGEPFGLAVGEVALADGGLHVRFAAVTEDSRCPLDVQCVWEGNAAVALDVWMTAEGSEALSLDTNPGFTTAADSHGYTIRLGDLEPYPKSSTRSEASYRAILVIEVATEPTTSAPDPSGSDDGLVIETSEDPGASGS